MRDEFSAESEPLPAPRTGDQALPTARGLGTEWGPFLSHTPQWRPRTGRKGGGLVQGSHARAAEPELG